MIRVVAAVSTLALACSAYAQSATYILPENGRTIRVTLGHQLGSDDAYQIISIDEGGRAFVFQPKSPVGPIPASVASATLTFSDNTPGLRVDSSRLFGLGEYQADHSKQTLLFFFNPGYGSDAAPLFVLGFLFDGTPYKVFEGSFVLDGMLQGRSRAVLVGRPATPQPLGCPLSPGKSNASATTYAPFAAYEVLPTLPAHYLLHASQAYNRSHYIWAGPHSREDVAAITNLPGRPKVVGVPLAKLREIQGPCR